MKTNFQKIFIGLSLSLVFFLGTNFVNAQTNDVNNSAQCSSVTNYFIQGYSSNSSGGTSFTTNNSVLQWYVNKPGAITRAANGNNNDMGVCKKTYTNGTNAKYEGWRVSLCKSDINSLKTHQESLFDAFKTAKSYNLNWGFTNHDAVWNLQELMSKAQCHTNRDCKLGVNTISNFLFCNVCSAISGNRKEINGGPGNPTCDTGHVLTSDKLCCQPASCQLPTISKGDESTKYGAEPFDVTVDYSANAQGDMVFNTGEITIVGGTASNYATKDKKITFTITPDPAKNEIKVEIGGDCAKLAGSLCPEKTENFHRDIPCQSTKDWAECINSGSFDMSSATGFQNIYNSNTGCLKGGNYIPFCTGECITWKVGESCEKNYGSGYKESDSGCCVNCGPNQKPQGIGCVCNNTESCGPGYSHNPNTCKCECDPRQKCCGIQLNTVVPFIGDCIEMTTQNDTSASKDPNTSTVNQLNAFPFLMAGLTKILVTVILVFSFLIVIAAGLMMTTGVYSETNYKKGMEWIQKIVVALILLGSSGLILKLINPSFFGG